MKLQDAPTAGIAAEVKKFQRKQAQFNAEGSRRMADDIGEHILKPLFAEMARRQALNGGEPDYRKWKA